MPDAAAGNETVVRRFIDGWVNGGNLDVIDETWSDDMSWHGGSLGTYEGREAFKRFTAANAPAHSLTCTSRFTSSSRTATRSSCA